MYRPGYISILCIFLLLSLSGLASAVPVATPSKAERVKVRRACDSLRLLARKHPSLRTRVKTALFKKREAEKVCREGFRIELPGVAVALVNGSTCRALAKQRPKTAQIKKILKRAGLLNRQADMRCVRTLKRLQAPKTNSKLGGNQ